MALTKITGQGIDNVTVNSSGNVLVGKTASSEGTAGTELNADGYALFVRDGNRVAQMNRLTSDGEILRFTKDGSTVGNIGSSSTSGKVFIGGGNMGITLGGSGRGYPTNASGVGSDNQMDWGDPSYRWDDIYATNGTIQTSDANEKQQIASLTDAEITAAKAISQLFKTFKWNDSVAEKGDAARIHTGVIAQEVQQAMTDAGLDAGDYAFFISTDWYVDADGNEVEADAEGAIVKNRKGIRYPELLAFIGAATEQRLANIETRLAALENV